MFASGFQNSRRGALGPWANGPQAKRFIQHRPTCKLRLSVSIEEFMQCFAIHCVAFASQRNARKVAIQSSLQIIIDITLQICIIIMVAVWMYPGHPRRHGNSVNGRHPVAQTRLGHIPGICGDLAQVRASAVVSSLAVSRDS